MLQTDVLGGVINEIASKQCVGGGGGGNKLNWFKAMEVLGGPIEILIWGSEIASRSYQIN